MGAIDGTSGRLYVVGGEKIEDCRVRVVDIELDLDDEIIGLPGGHWTWKSELARWAIEHHSIEYTCPHCSGKMEAE